MVRRFGRPASRWAGRVLILAAAILLARGGAPATAGAPANVVLILADDLGQGELGAYGARGIPTPNIDALARSGALFTDGYAPAPVCAPTRAGLMTGRHQQRFGFHHNPPPRAHPAHARFGLPAGEVTLADRLRALDHATGLVGKWHLGFRPRHFPLERGFGSFVGFLHGEHAYLGDDPEDRPFYRGRAVTHETRYLTRLFADEAAAFVRRHAARPFFLYAAFNAVHAPLQAEAAMLARFAHVADPKRRAFAAVLAHLDEAVGRIVAALRAAGLERRTLVAFSSDNGCITAKSTCRNAPLRGGKFSFHEGGIRVPFVLSWPGTIPGQRRVREPVTLRDLVPTALAAAAGAPYADARLDGVDLLPLARGEVAALPRRTLFWGDGRWGAVRRGNWKLLELENQPAQPYDLRRTPARAATSRRSAPAWSTSCGGHGSPGARRSRRRSGRSARVRRRGPGLSRGPAGDRPALDRGRIGSLEADQPRCSV